LPCALLSPVSRYDVAVKLSMFYCPAANGMSWASGELGLVPSWTCCPFSVNLVAIEVLSHFLGVFLQFSWLI
jgi:hypothetical protein